jgi:methyl-accepting chemotaxis protein
VALSAKNKIVFSVFFFFTLVILMITAISYENFSSSSNTSEKEKLDTVARAVGKAVSEKLDVYFNALELTARLFYAAPTDDPQTVMEYRDTLLKKLVSQTGVGVAYYCYANGTTYDINGLVPNFNAKKLGREWYKRLFAGEKRIVTTPYTSSQGVTVMAAGVPILRQGEVAGTLCINLGLKDITDFTNHVLDFKNLFLTRPNGDIMASDNAEDIGKILWELIPDLKQYKSLQSNGRVKFSYNGRNYEGSVFAIKSLDWKVWSFEQVDVIHADSRENMYHMSMVAAAALLISAIMLNLLASYLIFKPLNKSVAFAAAVSEGKLDETLDIDRKDEVGVLASALRSMVGRLKEMIQHSNEKERLAEQEAERARKAVAEAEEARREAELATQKGIMQAASQIEGVVERIASGTEELGAQADQISSSAKAQRERLAETATSMEQMNASVIEVARNSGDAATNAVSTQEEAGRGSDLVRQVIASVNHVQEQTLAMKEDLTALGQQADSIGAIMDVINDIADQTNLLALNAAIEAARAGDAGRGFAVVADEVRKLAEKTIGATDEVGKKISAIQYAAKQSINSMDTASTSVEETTTLAHDSGGVLENILSFAETNASQAQSIATAAEEQSAASEQISRTVDGVSIIANETSESMNESGRAIEQLAHMAGDLRSVVEQLKNA